MGKINWKDREAVNQYAREYRKNLTEEKRLIYKEQTRIYQKENPDKMRAANKRWRDENAYEYNKAYRMKNKERINERQRISRKNKKSK